MSILDRIRERLLEGLARAVAAERAAGTAAETSKAPEPSTVPARPRASREHDAKLRAGNLSPRGQVSRGDDAAAALLSVGKHEERPVALPPGAASCDESSGGHCNE
jgi:hypothetical protein